jgi:hypothetical protein
MHAPDDNPTPLQSFMRRTMLPWEYRHLRAVASVRFAAGGFTLAFGLVLLSLGRQHELLKRFAAALPACVAKWPDMDEQRRRAAQKHGGTY